MTTQINAANRLKASVVIEAAPVESDAHATYMKSFYSQLKKKVFTGDDRHDKGRMKFVKIKGFLAIRFATGDLESKVIAAMKSLGWKKVTPKTKIKNTTVYARQDGSWPLLCTTVNTSSSGPIMDDKILTLAAVDNISEF